MSDGEISDILRPPIAHTPIFCPQCALPYNERENDVKLLEAEYGQQARWHCFCGICGVIYTIECEL